MKRLIYMMFCLGVLLSFAACNEEYNNVPLVNDGIAPGKVTNTSVENKNGLAIISYKLPADDDILYVRASYVTDGGIQRESKSSYYSNSIEVTGFGSTNSYEVLLYAVDRGENESEPVSVTVNPLEPPYRVVNQSISTSADFGGIRISFENQGEDNIAIVVLAKDTLDNLVPYLTNYTKLPEGVFTVRGFDPVETTFGYYVRDQWGNISDTSIVNLTPLYEVELDKSKIKGIILPNDAPLGYGGYIDALFDGNVTGGWYHSGDAARMPQWFTFDLGSEVKLSRLAWWQRSANTVTLYTLHNPRKVEIWGSNDPATDGSWDSWELITEHEQIKPSGLPEGQLTNDDIAAADAGETVTIPLDAPAYRYIRFKTLQNWSNGTYVNFMEITLWGQPSE